MPQNVLLSEDGKVISKWHFKDSNLCTDSQDWGIISRLRAAEYWNCRLQWYTVLEYWG